MKGKGAIGQTYLTRPYRFCTLARTLGLQRYGESPLRIPRLLTIALALLGLAIIIATVYGALNIDRSLIREASFSLDTITPNADGDRDLTQITYSLSRDATLSIFFADEGGRTYDFRRDKERSAGDYQVLFSGVVDGFMRVDETNPHLLNALTDSDGKALSWIAIVSLLGWGLGYFGQPHILARFKAIRHHREMGQARRIAVSWTALTLLGAATQTMPL